MKDTRSVLLVLLSIGLMGTWVYHLYDKTMYSQRRTEIYVKDSAAVADGIRDSLQKIYTVTINNLDSNLHQTRTGADSLKNQLGTKLEDINKLRFDIGSILKNRGATKADLSIARQKIGELQEKVNELRNENTSMEAEKRELTDVMEQLNNDMQGLEQNVKRLSDENKNLTEKINQASIFVASEVQLNPVTVKNAKEEETTQAKKVSKLVVSFTVQNNINEYNNAEVMIVVTQPDGQVVLNSVWDSGTFETKNDGKKSYTTRVKFQYDKGEAKHLLLSLNPESYDKGNYTLQIYHNGIMIGRVVKTLI